MFVQTKENRYHVAFELDRSQPRAITVCKIFLLTDWTNSDSTLVGSGKTRQGKTDAFNSITGCKFALRRALTDYGFQKSTRTKFWKEFNRCHHSPVGVVCSDTGRPHKLIDACKSLYGYGGLHSFRQRKLPSHLTTKNVYAQHRHEYNEVIIPRSRAEKNQQLYEIYNGGTVGKKVFSSEDKPFNNIYGDYSKLEHRILRQAEGRRRRAGQQDKVVIVNTINARSSHGERLKELIMGEGGVKIKNILSDDEKRRRWLRRVWAVSDDRLGARMMSMSLNAAKLAQVTDVKLLSRAGITKVHDEYIVDPDKFVPAFKAGEVVTYKGDKARVYRTDGPLVTITCGQKVHEVFDHELKKWTHWLRRLWKRVANLDFPGDESLRKLSAEIPGRGLYKMIQDNHCDECHGRADFLQGPRGGSCSNVKCRYCGQRYWIDPLSATAKKI